jgi:hypothetical protein
MTLSLAPFDLRSVLHVCEALSSEEAAVYEALTGETFEADRVAAQMYLQPGMHWAAIDTQLRAVGGFARLRPGVLRTWFMAPDSTWSACGREMTDLVRTVIAQVLEQKLAHRIETITLADRTRARAWYERIGLTLEATLHGYCSNGQDAVLYVATRPVEKL